MEEEENDKGISNVLVTKMKALWDNWKSRRDLTLNEFLDDNNIWNKFQVETGEARTFCAEKAMTQKRKTCQCNTKFNKLQ